MDARELKGSGDDDVETPVEAMVLWKRWEYHLILNNFSNLIIGFNVDNLEDPSLADSLKLYGYDPGSKSAYILQNTPNYQQSS